MSGPSFQFVAFGIVVALIMSATRSEQWRERIMLAASVLFLTFVSTDPTAFIPLAGFLLVGYAALRLAPSRSTATFVTTIAGILVLFFWIKKYAFVPSALWLTFPYLTVGVSYMLFRLLHLVIEADEQPELRRMSLQEYLAYLIGFNTLIAGPIQTLEEYRSARAEGTLRGPTALDVGAGLKRIVIGLFKTNIVAAVLMSQREGALARLANGALPLAERWWAASLVFALYPLFLYCNFSGYIDIVVGISRLFLHRLPENFDRPFSSSSFIEFWSRWHITLSRWLRTYVYNPLLMASMRRFTSRTLEPYLGAFAFFVTFFLVGVWHGQTSGFVFFGFLQGFGVAVNKFYQVVMTKRLGRKPFERMSSTPRYEMIARGLTYTWFTFTLTWFWASWSEAAAVWSRLSVGMWVVVWLFILAASTLVIQAWETLRARVLSAPWERVSVTTSRRLWTVWYTAVVTCVAIAAVVSSQPAPQIIYKNF